MARKLFIFFLLFFVFATGQEARAALFSGDYLTKICAVNKRGEELVKGGKIACQSYISGVIDYHNMLRSMDLTSNMNFCIPESITLNELQGTVLNYLYRNKKLHRNFVAAPAVAMALFSTYPCRKKQ
jgi:hypothetical protein